MVRKIYQSSIKRDLLASYKKHKDTSLRAVDNTQGDIYICFKTTKQSTVS